LEDAITNDPRTAGIVTGLISKGYVVIF